MLSRFLAGIVGVKRPAERQRANMQSSDAHDYVITLPWGIVLDNVWAQLRPVDRAAVAETCKEAFTVIRGKLQTHVCLYVSQALSKHVTLRATPWLKTRFPFATRLTLHYDREVMEEEDGSATHEDCVRAACAVLAGLGAHPEVTACRLDGWEALPQPAVSSLLSALPSLACLDVSRGLRLELEALLLPGLTGLTSLMASADVMYMAPDVLRSAPVQLTQLRDLRLSGLQVNDQPADNDLCSALGALTSLTRLELLTFSAATRSSMVALRGMHAETLRGHPLARLPPALTGLTGLRALMLSDPHLERRTANSILAALTGLSVLEELVMPDARVREEGWLALQQMTSLARVHLYSIELRGQIRAKAPGSISWWRRLRLEDTCLPELASFMPVPGLASFIGTLYMRYGDGPVRQKDFAGLDRVLGTLGAADEVRLWLELDCDIWPGLSRILGQLPGLAEAVVRTRHPHPMQAADLSSLVSAATGLVYLDINNSALPDEALTPLEGLPKLTKLCLGVAARHDQVGHTPAAVQWLAEMFASRRLPSLVVAPHLLDAEMQTLEEWQAEDPMNRGSVTVAEALPNLHMPLPDDPWVSAGPFFRSHYHGGAAGAGGGGGGEGAGGNGGGGRFPGGGGGGWGGTVRQWRGLWRWVTQHGESG